MNQQTVAPASYSPEESQAKAIANLPEGLAIMRIENDNIMSLAAARPRSIAKVRQNVAEQLAEFPAHAPKMIYNKPVGFEKPKCLECEEELFQRKNGPPPTECNKCGSRRIKPGGQKFARNLSVRAAEMLAEAYGYNSVRVRVEDIDDNTVRVTARFFDYQQGRLWEDDAIVSKFYTNWKGQRTRIPDDRFYNVVVRAEGSKRIREVILRCVPAGLKAWLFDECESIIDDLLDESTVDKIIAKFSTKNVSLEQIERTIGKARVNGWTTEDRKTLMGLWTAIENEEATVSELFGGASDDELPQQKKPPVAPVSNGGASASDFTQPKGRAASSPRKPAAPAAAPEPPPQPTAAERAAASESHMDELFPDPPAEEPPADWQGSQANIGDEVLAILADATEAAHVEHANRVFAEACAARTIDPERAAEIMPILRRKRKQFGLDTQADDRR